MADEEATAASVLGALFADAFLLTAGTAFFAIAFFADAFAFTTFLAAVFLAAGFFVGVALVAVTFLTTAFLTTAFLAEGFVPFEAPTSAAAPPPSIRNLLRSFAPASHAGAGPR
ncbi:MULTISPECIES: hypothetical protein [Paraburkholderia]|uniref:Uncharacterized protein n=1 Tax=Paraburkholderia podalyriae TaxID=1938811 RepID=A0ABR7PYT4_9BURK|nr:hypothetical protein [Paraburkholderia podalyriae]MBC8751413.1 hypothetical protein [Paraburkholderia podalyriae]